MSRYSSNYSEGDIVTYSELKRRNASYSSGAYGRSDSYSANPSCRPDSSCNNSPWNPISANDANADLHCRWPGYPCNPCGPCGSCDPCGPCGICDPCGPCAPCGLGGSCGPCAFYPCMCYPWRPMGPGGTGNADGACDAKSPESADADSAPGSPEITGGPGKHRYLYLCYPIMYYPFMSYPHPWPMSSGGPDGTDASGGTGTHGIPGGPGYLCVCYPAPCPHDFGGPTITGTEAASAPGSSGWDLVRPFMCMCYLYPPKCQNSPGSMDAFGAAEAEGIPGKPPVDSEVSSGQGGTGAIKGIPGYMYMCPHYPRPPMCPHWPEKP